MGILLNELAPSVADLVRARNLRISREFLDEANFGNAIVDIGADGFDLRVVRDRGDVSLDVSPSGREDWQSLHKVLAFLDSQDAARGSREPEYRDDPSQPTPSLDTQVRALSDRFERVKALMQTNLARSGLPEFIKGRSAAYLESMRKELESE